MQAMLGPPPAGPAGKFRQFVKVRKRAKIRIDTIKHHN